MTQETEREKFEAWCRNKFGAHVHLTRAYAHGYIGNVAQPHTTGSYADVQMLWEAWQARAALEAKQVEVPRFNHAAKRKLELILGDGATVTGYAFQKADGRHGAIDCHGFVQWRTEQADHIEKHLEMVKMPEPVAYVHTPSFAWKGEVRPVVSFQKIRRRLRKRHPLYTEQQLRTLLEQHGIKIAD